MALKDDTTWYKNITLRNTIDHVANRYPEDPEEVTVYKTILN